MTKTKNIRKLPPAKVDDFRKDLLAWYDQNARDLPWRTRMGGKPDPYHVWLSEIMLQQTTVQAVKAYYLKFLQNWPDVKQLAEAEPEDVMSAWAGLGYYARARNLHKCAKIVAGELGGAFPDSQSALKKLPGIGDYTSAAITAIAFNLPAVVMDGNIERVMARYFAIEEPLPASKKTLKELTEIFFEGFTERPGDLAQAFMDLGAGVCIPKAPRCALCPLHKNCEGRKKGNAADLPVKSSLKARPQKYGSVYWVQDGAGRVLFHRRANKGMLGGMIGLPTSSWDIKSDKGENCDPDFIQDVGLLEGEAFTVSHSFTHFDLDLFLKRGVVRKVSQVPEDYFWDYPHLKEKSLPSLFQKVFSVFAKS